MIVTRRNHEIRELEIHNYNFETLTSFKYLGVDINKNANNHKEIKLRLVVAKKCQFSLIPLFKSKMLSWKPKITQLLITKYW